MLTLLPKGVKTKYLKNLSDLRFSQFATGVNDTGGAPWAANIYTNFLNLSNGMLRGLGEFDSWKKLQAKNPLTLSL
jgi:hypothetical protein